MNPGRRMTRRSHLGQAFTLVELLAAIGVLAILAVLLIPGLKSAVAKGKETRCVANLRQIGSAFIMYAGEHDGRIGNYDTDNLLSWGGNPPMWGGPPLSQRTLGPYISDAEVFHCPADIGGAGGNDLKNSNFKWAGNSYEVANSTERGVTYLSSSNGYRPGNSVPGTLAAVDEPSKVILAFDATFLRSPTVYWHPRDRSNVVLLDGHVESMPNQWGRDYPKNPESYSFGWNGWGQGGLWDDGQK